jgi:hypothetical protein
MSDKLDEVLISKRSVEVGTRHSPGLRSILRGLFYDQRKGS